MTTIAPFAQAHQAGPVPPLELTVHPQGFTGNDQVVSQDGATMLFYWDHHSGFSGWDAELKAGGPAGPVITRVSKGSFGSDFTVSTP
ncbi:hypothetical protein JCM10212_000582 [Sporobolomyces blumeae]